SASDLQNITFDDVSFKKAFGTRALGSTDVTPLSGSLMGFGVFHKDATVPKLMAFTTTDVYYYDTGVGHFFNITKGLVIEDCEDNWEDNANATSILSTAPPWRGSESVQVTIDAIFAFPGVAAYENFGVASTDLTTYTHLSLMIKS
ncbi:unnamed protein product, partial [marine sediment metagenome]